MAWHSCVYSSLSRLKNMDEGLPKPHQSTQLIRVQFMPILMKTKSSCLLLICLSVLCCSVHTPCSSQSINKTTYETSDKMATPETRMLFSNMVKLVDSGVLIGHHDDLAYGVGWRNEQARSDVQTVTGSYPAVYGWDLSGLELGHDADINSIPFTRQREFIKEIYARGGISTFCWHLNNPVNGKTAWDTSIHTIAQILPGATYHTAYRNYLDAIAKYLITLKGVKGEAIPLLFRPYHELTGTWFWWGKNTSSATDFKNLWRFTIDYLRKEKGLHNLLIVYSTSDFKTKEEFLDRYPGDGYVDIMGFDTYCRADRNNFRKDLTASLDILQQITTDHHKLGSIAEIGYEGIPAADWFTKDLLPAITTKSLSYLMFWRNANTHHFYVPYAGQMSAKDFNFFSNSKFTIFQNRLTPFHVYK